jgi:integrase/recombinase XerD
MASSKINKDYVISIFLDKRSKKKDGVHPIKLRVFNKSIQKAKLYQTDFNVSKKEFDSTWGTVKPREENKQLRLKLQALENNANDVAKTIIPFTFEKFERKLFSKTKEIDNVLYKYSQQIDKLMASGNIGNADTYKYSLNSFKAFISGKKLKNNGRKKLSHTANKEDSSAKLTFLDITKEWLENYQKFMVKDNGKSLTTVSIYLRTLRSLYNAAIRDNEAYKETYPFGKDKFILPSVSKVKKTLSKVELKTLFNAEPKTIEQCKAKDFWFLSYACNGMNIKDIALLTTKDINEDTVKFYRAKTINTSKSNLREVTVYLNDFSRSVFAKYADLSKGKNEYIFSIVSDNDSEITKHSKIKNFTKFINQHIKLLALGNALTPEISSYWARHSFATNAIRNGASMEFVMDALDHSNMKTTQNYFSGFEDEDKKQFMQSLMNF